ncbi:MAG: CopG family transcriptional regulator [Chloroflexota bacterium]
MKRTSVSAPEDLLERLRSLATRRGVSLAEVIREAMEAKVVGDGEETSKGGAQAPEARLKPRSIGMFRSGHTDTARLAGEHSIEPPPWRSS